MELKNVKLKAKLEPQSGVGQQSGKEWVKQTVILEETDSKYPKTIALTAWGSVQSDIDKVAIGTEMDCEIKVESREYNGKWYTDAIMLGFYYKEGAKQYVPVNKEPMRTVEPQAEYKRDTDLPF